MRDSDIDAAITVAISFAILGFVLGMAVQGCVMSQYSESIKKEWMTKSVESGAAYYDPKTGDFTWKEKVEDVE